jgi:hypothetical protein
MTEGDILVIHQGQPGAGFLVPGFYEIAEVISSLEMRLLISAPTEDPTTFGIGASPAEPELDPDLFEYGESLTGSIVRRLTFGAVRKGQDLTTTNATSQGTVVSAGLLNDGVSPGHHLIIEGGANEGEYLIDGVNATPPYVTDSAMSLLCLDGLTPAVVADATDQDYWILDPRQRVASIDGAKSVYTGSRIELEVLDPVTGVEFHLFTPGMVGTLIWVSNSDQAVNDGEFLITEYLSPGKVALDSTSTTSDTAAQSTVYF